MNNANLLPGFCLILAKFMTAVVVSFILQAPIGFNLAPLLSNAVGVVAGLGAMIFFLVYGRRCCRNPSAAA